MAAESRSGRAVPRPRLPPLRALVAFESAARHGSFAQAADELGVTPSAVSHQIQSLEAFLGLALFVRRGGRVSLTGAGHGYRREIDGAFRIIADATTALSPRRREETLVILVSPSFAVRWLQPRLPRFLAGWPAARIRLATSSAGTPLDQENFDVAIAYGRPERSGAVILPLLKEQLTPLCSPGLAEALSLSVVADLGRATLIHSQNLIPWKEFFAAAGVPDLQPTNELWIDRSVMAISAAVDGLGVVLESDILTEGERSERTLIAPFADAKITSVCHFLTVTPSARSRRDAALFIEWLAAEIPAESRAWSGDLVALATGSAGRPLDSVRDRVGQSLAQNPRAALLNTAGRSS
jgi:LysR family glycine cleavage system transcriptional activator